jgi:branched-chain amino acid transport system substrate-binding protein
MTRALLTALAVLSLLAPAAAAQELTIYSSMPLQGVSKFQTEAIVAGARRALADAGGQAAGRPVRYVSLDNSTSAAGTWTPEATSRNARRAARDVSTIGYLGEFNSGASAISMPILNAEGILQISPSNTYTGLTMRAADVYPGEPAKFYPTGKRHYGRIVPNDVVQARAIAALLAQRKARRVFIAHDRELYGRGIARLVQASLKARGIRVVRFTGIDVKAPNYRRLARLTRSADAFFYGGITANNAVQLFRDVARANRRMTLVAPDGVAEAGFADPREGGIPASVARRVLVTVATLSPSSYPPSSRPVFDALGPDPDPYAIYGYEAMAVMLDAINRGGPTREGAIAAFFATRDRDSVLGRYSIKPTGDTTLTSYGVYRIERGELRFDRVVEGTPR